MYALSLVPPKPSLKGLENPPNVFLKIVAGLEVSGLAIDGQDVNQGGSDGKRTAQRKRSVAASGRTALATNIFTPPSTGYVDDDGLAFSDSMSKELADVRELTTRVEEGFFQSGSDRAPPYPDLRTFRLAEATVTPMGGHPIAEKIEVVREFTISVLEPLPEGATGTFKAFVLGVDHDNKRAFFSEKEEDVTVTVIENSHDIFRAKVKGRICEGALTQEAYMARVQSGQRWCERQFTISGEVIKPFAYLYRIGSTMVSRETEGEKLYNTYGHNRQDGFSGVGGSQTNDGTGQTGDSSSENVGDLVACDCGCANRALVEVADPTCSKQCQLAWAACEANPSASTDQSTTKQSRMISKETSKRNIEDDEKQAKKKLKRLEETFGMNFSKLGESFGIDVTKLKGRSRKERKAIKKALAEKLMKKRDQGFQSAFGMSAEELEKLDKAEQRKIFRARGGMKGIGQPTSSAKQEIAYDMPPPMPQGGFLDGSQALVVSQDLTATIEFSSNQEVPLTMVAVDLARQVIVSQSTKSSPITEKINLREYSVEPTDLLIELVNTETRNVVARYRPVGSES